MNNQRGNLVKYRKVANDVIYTPKIVAQKLIEMCDLKEGDKVLDPCFGGGVFYNNLPDYVDKYWCEIEKDKDFFDFNERMDCIIGNPPFSIWNKWLEHTMKITDKFAYVMGNYNLSARRLAIIHANGYGITKMHILNINWYFGTSYLIIFEKNKPSIISVEPATIKCDVCNKNCKRGLKGNSYNICTNIPESVSN